MAKVNNIKFGKKFIAGLLAFSLVGSGIIGSYQLYKKSQINRVKGYLEDFLTEDNYVDLTNISSDYSIEGFDGKYLDDAMEELGVNYVRITDSYIYNGSHVTPFTQVNGINYDNVLFVDQDGTEYYEMYEPIRDCSEDGVCYYVPDNFVLEEYKVLAEPIRYEDLNDRKVVVRDSDYEEGSYTLSLERKK